MQSNGLAETNGDPDPVPGPIPIFRVGVPEGKQQHALNQGDLVFFVVCIIQGLYMFDSLVMCQVSSVVGQPLLVDIEIFSYLSVKNIQPH